MQCVYQQCCREWWSFNDHELSTFDFLLYDTNSAKTGGVLHLTACKQKHYGNNASDIGAVAIIFSCGKLYCKK